MTAKVYIPLSLSHVLINGQRVNRPANGLVEALTSGQLLELLMQGCECATPEQGTISAAQAAAGATGVVALVEDPLAPAPVLTAAQVSGLQGMVSKAWIPITAFKRDGESDYTQAAQRAAESDERFHWPAGGTYYISDTITFAGDSVRWQPVVQMEIQGGAVVKATSAFPAGSAMVNLTADTASHMTGFSIYGKGVLDCNNYAAKGVHVLTGARGRIRDLVIKNPTLYGVHVRGSGSAGGSEVHCEHVQPFRDEGTTNDANSVGILYENITDSRVLFCDPVGFRTGLKNYQVNTEFWGCHPWAKRGHGPMRYGFWIEGSGSTAIRCYADTPHRYLDSGGTIDNSFTDAYGFFINSYGVTLIYPWCYMNNAEAEDNLVTGIWLNKSDGIYGTIIGDRYDASDSSKKYKRLIAQLSSSTLTNLTRFGGQYGAQTYSTANMGDQSARPYRLQGYTVATLPNATLYPGGTIYVSDGTANKRFAISDGTNWRWPDGAIVS